MILSSSSFWVDVFVDRNPLLVLCPCLLMSVRTGEMLVDRLPCEARPRCILFVFDDLELRRFGWETCHRMVVSHKFGLRF